MKALKHPLALIVMSALVAACADRPDDADERRAVTVTAAEVRVGEVRVTERTVGRIEAAVAPTISAEVAGRVVEVLRDAGDRVEAGAVLARIDDTNYRSAVERLAALEAQQRRTVERYTQLVAVDSASRSLLDEAEAQLASMRTQLADARTALAKTRVTAPVAGVIERRTVSVGDFRNVGEPLFALATDERLRVVLPFPERRAADLAVGQKVILEPHAGGSPVEATITELRPTVGLGSRALDALVEIDNPGGWRAGGGVTATAVLAVRPAQPLVPVQAVVQRPAGQVVYVVDGDVARQRRVDTGVRTNGEVEVLHGLAGGERIVVDGAGFLTDGARIEVRGR